MNEDNDILNALTGETAVNPADTTDWKAKFEEAQKQLASAHVEQGRVKKLNEEKAELQRQLDEAKASRLFSPELAESLPDETRQGLTAVQKASQDAIAQAEARHRAELDALKAQMAERDSRDAAIAKRAFTARIEAAYPGFIVSVCDGGDKAAAWKKYQRFNAASISAAVNACDFEALSYHIGKFFTDELGIDPPSGGTGAAAPDPSAVGGGTPVAAKPGKVYTWDEIDKLYDEIEVLRSRGDREGMKRLSDEVEKAQKEGRVK
jgi:hypothetical protein